MECWYMSSSMWVVSSSLFFLPCFNSFPSCCRCHTVVYAWYCTCVTEGLFSKYTGGGWVRVELIPSNITFWWRGLRTMATEGQSSLSTVAPALGPTLGLSTPQPFLQFPGEPPVSWEMVPSIWNVSAHFRYIIFPWAPSSSYPLTLFGIRGTANFRHVGSS